MKKVSIIVPVYNVEAEIKGCIESIIRQTYKEWELWLIDDGSTDKSSIICDEYERKYDRINVVHKVNAGVSSARNTGLTSATGDYVLFVDSDDYLEENAIERMVEVAEEKGADIVLCGFYQRHVDDNSVVKNIPFTSFEGNNKEFIKSCFIRIFQSELINPPWNKLIRRSVLEQNDIKFNVDFSILEDISFSIQTMEKCHKIVILQEALYNYFYKKQGNLVYKFHENFYEALLFLDECLCKYCSLTLEKNVEYVRHEFFFQKTLAYLRKLYRESHYDKKMKYRELCRICGDQRLQECVRLYKAQGISKKLVSICIRYKLYWGLHLMYLLT